MVGSMVYDAVDHYVLLLQYPANGAYGSTSSWTYANGVWDALNLTMQPGACAGSSMAYDGADDYVLYLGGFNCSSADQTWTFSSGVWTQINPSPAPPFGEYESLAFDPAKGFVLLFGGFNASYCYRWGCNGTWAFSHGAWTDLTPSLTTLPPARVGANLVYDPADGDLVLFGGSGWVNNSPASFNDTWTFNGTNWSELTSNGGPHHPDQIDFTATYDSALNEIVAFDGSTESRCTVCNQTWAFQSGSWTNITATAGSPPPGLWELAFDPTTNRTIAFGFAYTDYYTSGHGALWSFTGGRWGLVDSGFGPPSTYYGVMAYDESDGYVVLFGGCTPFGSITYSCVSNDTWTFHAGVWTNATSSRAPPARVFAGMTYDAADGYILLFGGLTQPTPSKTVVVNDTWEFVNGSWSQLTPIRSPPPSEQPDLVYDGADGYVLMVTGSLSWTFLGGVWTNITGSVTNAPTEPTGAIAYDATDRYVVLFGNYSTSDPAFDTSVWTYSAGTWTDRTASGPLPGSPPTLWFDMPFVYDPARGAVELYTQWGNGTVFEYRAGGWSKVVPVTAPPSVEDEEIAYDGSDGYLLMFSGALIGAVGGTLYEGTWAWTNVSGPGPLALSSFSASPNPLDVGVTARIAVNVSGGVGAYSYSYTSLPPSCSSANSSLLDCTPSASGDYPVSVIVVDSKGERLSKTLDLEVASRPTITSFTESPANVAVGNRTILSTVAAGGVGPLSYRYSGLPPGCSSQDVPTLPCTPNMNGSYRVSAIVFDSELNSTVATAPILVACAGPSGGPNICGFSATPYSLVLGNNTTFQTVIVNTSAVGEFQYSGLPPGCASTNANHFSCTPSVSGEFLPQVTLVSLGGATVSAETKLTVLPVSGGPAAVKILAFSAAPSNITIGNSTVLEILVEGGTGNYSYAYSGLPPNCFSQDVASLLCSPSEAGVYRPYVVVSDGAASGAGAFLTLYVAGRVNQSPGEESHQASTSPTGPLAVAFGLGALVAAGFASIYGSRRAKRASAGPDPAVQSRGGGSQPPNRG